MHRRVQADAAPSRSNPPPRAASRPAVSGVFRGNTSPRAAPLVAAARERAGAHECRGRSAEGASALTRLSRPLWCGGTLDGWGMIDACAERCDRVAGPSLRPRWLWGDATPDAASDRDPRWADTLRRDVRGAGRALASECRVQRNAAIVLRTRSPGTVLQRGAIGARCCGHLSAGFTTAVFRLKESWPGQLRHGYRMTARTTFVCGTEDPRMASGGRLTGSPGRSSDALDGVREAAGG